MKTAGDRVVHVAVVHVAVVHVAVVHVAPPTGGREVSAVTPSGRALPSL